MEGRNHLWRCECGAINSTGTRGCAWCEAGRMPKAAGMWEYDKAHEVEILGIKYHIWLADECELEDD